MMSTLRLLRVATGAALLAACGAPSSGPTGSAPNGSDTTPDPNANSASSGSSSSGGGGAAAGSGKASTPGVGGNAGGGSGAATSGSGNGASGGASAGSSAGGTGSGAVGSTSGAAGSPPANDPNTVILKMTDFTVPAGGEVFMCQDFDNPFAGMDAAINRSESDMTAGSHHLHLFYGADSPPSPTATACANPFEFRSVLHIAGSPVQVTTYPSGMAAKLKGTSGLRMQVHYLNPSSTPLTASVQVKLTKTDPSHVQNWVAVLYFNRTVLTVPTGNGQTVTTTCTVPSTFGPIGLIGGGSHMHKRGVHFVATTNKGFTLVDTTQWDAPPPLTYDPPVMLNPGDSITWTCTYDNNTGAPLTFGDSAQKNEMCIYVGKYYSSPNGNDIECQSTSPMGAGAVTNNAP